MCGVVVGFNHEIDYITTLRPRVASQQPQQRCTSAGASTIAELTVAGRPAILVPLPGAMDDHQTANVREMVEAGGARAIAEADFTPVELAKQMQKLGLDPVGLTNAARRARGCGRPEATRDLADLIESLMPTPTFVGHRDAGDATATTTLAAAGA